MTDDKFQHSPSNLQKSINVMDIKNKQSFKGKTPPTLDNVRYEVLDEDDLAKIKKPSMSVSPQPKRVPESKQIDALALSKKEKKDTSPLKEKKPLTNTKIVLKKNKNRLKSLISNRMVEKARLKEQMLARKHQHSRSIHTPHSHSRQSTHRSH